MHGLKDDGKEKKRKVRGVRNGCFAGPSGKAL
jgi:hypothetical protein